MNPKKIIAGIREKKARKKAGYAKVSITPFQQAGLIIAEMKKSGEPKVKEMIAELEREGLSDEFRKKLLVELATSKSPNPLQVLNLFYASRKKA